MEKPKTKKLKTSEIIVDWSQNPRLKHPEHVTDLREAIQESELIPPVKVFEVDGKYRLAEGFHRIEAYKAETVAEIDCEVIAGTLEEWKIACYSGNRGQRGLKRTRAERKKAVLLMLESFPRKPIREIATLIDISYGTAQAIKAEWTSQRQQAADTKKKSERQSSADDVTAAPESSPDTGHTAKPEMPERAPDCEGVKGGVSSPVAEPEVEIEPPRIVPTKPPPEVDKWGIPIQPHAVEAFAAVPMFKVLIEQARQLAIQFHRLAETNGGQFLQLPEVSSYRVKGKTKEGRAKGEWVHDGLDRFIAQLKAMMPLVTVCPYQFVEAPHPENCSLCHGLEWVPNLTAIPDELKSKIVQSYGVNIEG